LRIAAIGRRGARVARSLDPGAGRRCAVVKGRYWTLVAGVVLVLCVAASLATGRVWFDPVTLFGSAFEPKPNLAWLILSELRLPRTILGLLVGATLGLSGA